MEGGEPTEAIMGSTPAAATFEPETIELMRVALDGAMAKMPNRLQTSSVNIEIAELILNSVARGERDGSRLRDDAVNRVIARHSGAPSVEAATLHWVRPL